jgi:hypothetical protein
MRLSTNFHRAFLLFHCHAAPEILRIGKRGMDIPERKEQA